MAMTRLRNEVTHLRKLLKADQSKSVDLDIENKQLRETLAITQNEFRQQTLCLRDQLITANSQLGNLQKLSFQHGATADEVETAVNEIGLCVYEDIHDESMGNVEPNVDSGGSVASDQNVDFVAKLAQKEQLIQSLRDSVARLQNDQDMFQKTVASQQARLQDISEGSPNASINNSSTINNLKAQISRLHAKIQTLTMAQTDASTANEALRREKAKNNELNERIATLSELCKSLQAENSIQQSRIEDFEVSISDKKRWMSESETLRTDLIHARKMAEKAANSFTNTLEVSKSKFEDEQKKISQKVKLLESQISDLKLQCKDSMNDASRANARAQELERVFQTSSSSSSSSCIAHTTPHTGDIHDGVLTHSSSNACVSKALQSDCKDFDIAAKLIEDLRSQLRKETRRCARLENKLGENTIETPIADADINAHNVNTITNPTPIFVTCNASVQTYTHSSTDDNTHINTDSTNTNIGPPLSRLYEEAQQERCTLEQKVLYLQDSIQTLSKDLMKSRQEVINIVRRVKSGALIVDQSASMTNNYTQAWSSKAEREDLFHRMRIVMMETNLHNVKLTDDKNQLGAQLSKTFTELQTLKDSLKNNQIHSINE